MFKLSLLIFFIGIQTSLFAQDKYQRPKIWRVVFWVMYWMENRVKPLSFASIRLKGHYDSARSISIVADKNGGFDFQKLLPGYYALYPLTWLALPKQKWTVFMCMPRGRILILETLN